MNTNHCNQINKYMGLFLNVGPFVYGNISSNVTFIWLNWIFMNYYLYLNTYERQFYKVTNYNGKNA